MNNYTRQDIDDLIEGFKKRPQRQLKKIPKMDKRGEMIEYWLENKSVEAMADEFRISKPTVISFLEEIGVI